ncbi:NUDIX hydrolase [Microbispora sp. RL4-1S]|uniref:NUDIX hydrolase n=2 Tax=Microbispora oryzae TaxID=2806554 RepID=A0A940WGQ4_9ACTN|nr:NUDIX hydrolase [Microbispora oryzae]
MIRAAGAVVWRGDEAAPEVALVHRPRYDDWSLPKGKLQPGEHVVAAALREVAEETGLDVVLGRALPPVHYMRDGRLKRVDYWTARVADDPSRDGPSRDAASHAPDEVDEVAWFPVEEARRRVTYRWDADLLGTLTAAPLVTTPLIFVRHALAGSRQEWRGDDDLRPLDRRGRAQARTLADVLRAYRPGVLVTSPSLRCVQTVEPYADLTGREPRREAALSESGFDPAEADRVVRDLAASGEAAVVCSHGKVLPHLLALAYGRPPADANLAKGGLAVFNRVPNRAGGRVVTVERYLT